MTRHTESMPAAYFEGRYQKDIDPWDFRSSAYEREKYDATLTALSRPIYQRVLEVGCSIGVLTAKLARRSGRLLAIDASQTAIDAARENAPSNVTFEKRVLPGDFPEGPFDLIVLSEVLYYFSEADLRLVADLCCAALAPGGEMALCHWLGQTDYPLTGRQASDIFADAAVMRARLAGSFAMRFIAWKHCRPRAYRAESCQDQSRSANLTREPGRAQSASST